MGQYHTIDLELNRKFTIAKDYWDCIAIERVGKLHVWLILQPNVLPMKLHFLLLSIASPFSIPCSLIDAQNF